MELTDIQIRTTPATNWQDGFRAWLQGTGRMPKTVMAYQQDLRHFSKFFEQVNGLQFTPEQLNATDIKAYFSAQDQDHSVAPTSRNRRLASLRVLVEWAVAKGILEYDPTVSIKRVSVEMRPRDRSPDEMQTLEGVVSIRLHLKRKTDKHNLLGLRDEVIWGLFTEAGLRIHEISGLNQDDLNLEAGEIHVLGKGAKKGIVIIPSSLVKLLSTWLKQKPQSIDQAVVCDWNGHRITTGQIRRRLYLIGQFAGVDVKPHDLRHTYVYSLLDAMLAQGKHMPVALDAARKQARHGDVKTTMLYLRSRESQIRAAVEAI
jgi:integrase/recombinase XerC